MFHSIGLNFWPEGIKHPACKFSTSHRMNLHQLRIIRRDMLTGNLQQLTFSPPWKEPAPEGTGTGGVSKGHPLGWLKLSCLLSSCSFRPVSHTFLSSSFGVVSVGCHRPVTARFHAVLPEISLCFTVIHPSPLVGQGRLVLTASSVGRCMFLHLVRLARLLSEEHLP